MQKKRQLLKELVLIVIELHLLVATYFITPLTILISLVGHNFLFWTINLLGRHLPEKAAALRGRARVLSAWYWRIFSRVWHGHEVIGRENIPCDGPALILYYHGALPVDYYYLVADTVLSNGRTIHSVVDKFIFKIPGFSSLMRAFNSETGSIESCTAVLRKGEILGISPGGTYEAQFGDNMYKVLWRATTGFARVVQEVQTGAPGLSVPIIPVFTQNIREAYRAFNFGFTRRFWLWLHEKRKIRGFVPVYGGFPVKLKTFIGSGIRLPSSASVEEIRALSLESLEKLISQHQTILPGNTWRALAERVSL